MDQQRTIRVLVADDHPTVREGLVGLLQAPGHIEVVGQAADAAEAEHLANKLQPDVILLDIRLQGNSGIEVCRTLNYQVPGSRVIMLTSFEDEDYLFRALQAGAWGYLTKTATQEEIEAAIAAVASGERLLSTVLMNCLVARFAQVAGQMELVRQQATG